MSRVQLLSAPRVGAKIIASQRGRVRIPTGRTKGVLSKAEARWAASGFNPGLTPQYLKDLTGKGHHMRLGSVGRADVMDGALVTPGLVGNWAQAPAEAQTQLLDVPTSTFDGGTHNWVAPTNSTLAVSAAQARSGPNSLAITATGVGATIVRTNFLATPNAGGKAFSARGYIRGATAGRSHQLGLRFYDAANVALDAIRYGTAVTDTTTGWTEVNVSAIAPANTAQIIVWLANSDATTVATEVHYLDDLRLFEAVGTDVVGDIDIRWIGSLDNMAPGSMAFGGKEGAAGNRSYLMYIQASGAPRFRYSTDGTTLVDVVCSASPLFIGAPGPFGNGQMFGLRVTRNATTGDVTWYATANGEEGPWTQIGAVNPTTPGLMYASTAPVDVAAHQGGNGSPLAGRTRQFTVRRGINGPKVFDANFRNQPDGCAWFNEDAGGKRVTVYPLHAVVLGGKFFSPGLSQGVQVAHDTAAFTPVGVQEMVGYITPTSWNIPGNSQEEYFLAHALGTGNQRSWRVGLIKDGRFIWYGSTNGTAENYALVNHGITQGSAWVRFTYDPTTGKVKIEINTTEPSTANPDAIAWTQLADTNTHTAGQQVFNSNARVTVGGYNDNTAGQFNGEISRAYWKNNGVIVVDFDFSKWGDGEGVAMPKKLPTGHYAKVVTDLGGADTNDPTFLPYEGQKYAYFSGNTTNQITSPNQVAFDWRGNDQEAVLRVAADDWTPSGAQVFISQYEGGGERAFRWGMTAGGNGFFGTDNGAGVGFNTSGALFPAVDGQILWVKYTFERDTGGGFARIRQYYALDTGTNEEPSNWTLLATSSATVAHDMGFPATVPVVIGAQSAGGTNAFVGKIFYARLRKGATLDSLATVLEFDASKLTAPYTRHLVTDSKNLLPGEQSDLEAGSSVGWNTNDSGNILVTAGNGGIQGSLALALSRKTTTGQINATLYYAHMNLPNQGMQTTPVVAGEQYTAQCTVRAATTPRTFSLTIDWFNSAGTHIGSTAAGAGVADAVGSDTLITCTGVAVAGAAFAALTINSDANAVAGEVHYADKFQIESGALATSWVRGRTYQYLNRTSSSKKLTLVDRALFLLGGDDYFECPDHSGLDFTLAQSLTLAAGLRRYGQPASTEPGWIVGKRGSIGVATDAGYYLSHTSTNHSGTGVGDAAVIARVTTAGADLQHQGVASLLAMVRDMTADALSAWLNGVKNTGTDLATATLENTHVMRIGTRSGAVTANDFEFFGAGLWREALSDADVTNLRSLMGAAS